MSGGISTHGDTCHKYSCPLQDDPPLLPTKKGFSIEFCSFVRDCLMKNYKDRPKYRKLLQHPFIQRYEKEVVDVGAWYRSHMNTADGVSPNNNTAAAATASTPNATNSQQLHSQGCPAPFLEYIVLLYHSALQSCRM